jgi:hypothetical protein
MLGICANSVHIGHHWILRDTVRDVLDIVHGAPLDVTQSASTSGATSDRVEDRVSMIMYRCLALHALLWHGKRDHDARVSKARKARSFAARIAESNCLTVTSAVHIVPSGVSCVVAAAPSPERYAPARSLSCNGRARRSRQP